MARPRLPKNQITAKRAGTRALLIETAAKLVNEQGFSQTTLDQVAARARVTKGAIYGNFASKEELMLAVVSAKGASIGHHGRKGASPREQMRSLARAFLKMTKGYGVQHAVETAEYHLYAFSSPSMAKLLETRAHQRWKTLESMRASTETPHIMRREISALVQAIQIGLMYQRTLTPGLITDASVIKLFECLATIAQSLPSPPKDSSRKGV